MGECFDGMMLDKKLGLGEYNMDVLGDGFVFMMGFRIEWKWLLGWYMYGY